MRTALKREITSSRILDATYRTIAARGWGAVTLREIAEESGVALSQLSYYFGNKDGLFAAVLDRMQQEYAENLAAKLRGATSLRERLERLIDYNRLLLKENTDLYRDFLEFFNFAMASPEFKKQVTTFLAGISKAIEEQITQKQKSNRKLGSFSSTAITHFCPRLSAFPSSTCWRRRTRMWKPVSTSSRPPSASFSAPTRRC